MMSDVTNVGANEITPSETARQNHTHILTFLEKLKSNSYTLLDIIN